MCWPDPCTDSRIDQEGQHATTCYRGPCELVSRRERVIGARTRERHARWNAQPGAAAVATTGAGDRAREATPLEAAVSNDNRRARSRFRPAPSCRSSSTRASGRTPARVEAPVRAHLSRAVVVDGATGAGRRQQRQRRRHRRDAVGKVKGRAHVAVRFDSLTPRRASDERYRIADGRHRTHGPGDEEGRRDQDRRTGGGRRDHRRDRRRRGGRGHRRGGRRRRRNGRRSVDARQGDSAAGGQRACACVSPSR